MPPTETCGSASVEVCILSFISTVELKALNKNKSQETQSHFKFTESEMSSNNCNQTGLQCKNANSSVMIIGDGMMNFSLDHIQEVSEFKFGD